MLVCVLLHILSDINNEGEISIFTSYKSLLYPHIKRTYTRGKLVLFIFLNSYPDSYEKHFKQLFQKNIGYCQSIFYLGTNLLDDTCLSLLIQLFIFNMFVFNSPARHIGKSTV